MVAILYRPRCVDIVVYFRHIVLEYIFYCEYSRCILFSLGITKICLMSTSNPIKRDAIFLISRPNLSLNELMKYISQIREVMKIYSHIFDRGEFKHFPSEDNDTLIMRSQDNDGTCPGCWVVKEIFGHNLHDQWTAGPLSQV